jgi:hypothetical protein
MHRRRSRRNEERRKHLFAATLRLAIAAAVFGVVAYYAYEAGFRVAASEVASLKEEVKQAVATAQTRETQAEADRAALVEARKQADDYKALYEQEKPTDDLRDLTAILRGKLAEGMDAHRLGLAIKSARNPRGCEVLGTKKFLVRTPHYKGPEAITLARFDDMAISAEGVGANGGHEQWFDPDRPVTVRVSASGAKTAELAGNLPIEHALAVKNSEYHFTVTAANARGWVEVLTERCDFR